MTDLDQDPVRNNNLSMQNYLSNIYCQKLREVNKDLLNYDTLVNKAHIKLKDLVFCRLEKSASELKNYVDLTITSKEFWDLLFQNKERYLPDNFNTYKFLKSVISLVRNDFINQGTSFYYSLEIFDTQRESDKFTIQIYCTYSVKYDNDLTLLK